MKKDEIFFGQQILTSTSANFIANQAKNAYQQLEKELDNIRFYDKFMTLIGTNTKDVLSDGVRSVGDINEKLYRVAKLKSLIAWCREGIRAKENLVKEAQNMSYEDFGIELPERPISPVYLTEDEIVGSWNIKQLNRYYYLETLCAEIGKYIHPDGVFAQQRDKMFDVIHNPRTVSGNGRDTIVYTYETSLPVQEVEDKFMELQNLHRTYQAELNSMKHEIETAIEDDKKSKNLQYQTDYANYSELMQVKNAELKRLKDKKLSDIQKLKIVIPDSLRPIYEEVSALGKKQS